MTKIKGKESIFVLKEKGKKLYFTFDNKFKVVFILPIKFDFIFKIFLSFIFVIDLIIKKTMPFSSLLTVRIVTNINEITNYNTKIESNPGFFMFDLKEKKRRKRKEQGRKESKLSVLLG